MKHLTALAFSTLLLVGFSSCSGLADLANINPTVEISHPTETPTVQVSTQPVASAVEAALQPQPGLEAASTPDPCSPENIGEEVEKVHRIMREFDDASSLASSTPSQQLYNAIADMQRIRRDAEDLTVPACLEQLQLLQLNHMETVINTLLVFYSDANAEVVNAGILQARQEYELYMLELSSVLGLTPASPPVQSPGEVASITATQVLVKGLTVILNAGLNAANMRDTPSKDGHVVDFLYAGQQADVFGRSEDGTWLLVGIPSQPDKKAWVAGSVLEILEGDPNALPVVISYP